MTVELKWEEKTGLFRLGKGLRFDKHSATIGTPTILEK